MIVNQKKLSVFKPGFSNIRLSQLSLYNESAKKLSRKYIRKNFAVKVFVGISANPE